MSYIRYKNNNLFVENVSVRRLALKFSTPFYLYSESNIIENYKSFSNNFKKHEITMLIVKDSFPSSIPVRSSAKPPRQRRGFTTNLTTRG